MAASEKTVQQLEGVMLDWMNTEINMMYQDGVKSLGILFTRIDQEVEGNKSFRDTIKVVRDRIHSRITMMPKPPEYPPYTRKRR